MKGETSYAQDKARGIFCLPCFCSVDEPGGTDTVSRFADSAFLAQVIGMVGGRRGCRVAFVSYPVDGFHRLGRQMRVGKRNAERKQKSVFRREYC